MGTEQATPGDTHAFPWPSILMTNSQPTLLLELKRWELYQAHAVTHEDSVDLGMPTP